VKQKLSKSFTLLSVAHSQVRPSLGNRRSLRQSHHSHASELLHLCKHSKIRIIIYFSHCSALEMLQTLRNEERRACELKVVKWLLTPLVFLFTKCMLKI